MEKIEKIIEVMRAQLKSHFPFGKSVMSEWQKGYVDGFEDALSNIEKQKD